MSKQFDDAIITPNGKRLVTLRDAIKYLGATVPKHEHNHPKVLTAADHLTRSAEQGYPLFFARAATLQAIHRNEKRVLTNRKDHHWSKRKLKRDQ